jgi:hypothetical protein
VGKDDTVLSSAEYNGLLVIVEQILNKKVLVRYMLLCEVTSG